jgi:hypothetical protein
VSPSTLGFTCSKDGGRVRILPPSVGAGEASEEGGLPLWRGPFSCGRGSRRQGPLPHGAPCPLVCWPHTPGPRYADALEDSKTSSMLKASAGWFLCGVGRRRCPRMRPSHPPTQTHQRAAAARCRLAEVMCQTSSSRRTRVTEENASARPHVVIALKTKRAVAACATGIRCRPPGVLRQGWGGPPSGPPLWGGGHSSSRYGFRHGLGFTRGR